tara:strand:+ start:457 stop:687 length:231 start_codon:yes stop_codon:yes gene_type:complete
MENERRTQLNITIDAKLLKSLKLKSIVEDKTLSEYIVNILESHNNNNDDNSDIYQTKIAELESRISSIEQMLNSSN